MKCPKTSCQDHSYHWLAQVLKKPVKEKNVGKLVSGWRNSKFLSTSENLTVLHSTFLVKTREGSENLTVRVLQVVILVCMAW